MRLDTIHKIVGGKKYTSHLLRHAYRENGKVRHRTIANLSSCSDEEIQAIRLALSHKGDLTQLSSFKDDLKLKQGLSVGAVFTLFAVSRHLGIQQALGNSQAAKQALWQVIARIIDQGSRLSAVRLAGSHAACDVLDLKSFDEDDLYLNLDWLCENQELIEDRLFRQRHPDGKAQLFLYDVTSSYLEGVQNELAAFGYNRDGKKGKMQIVIGLLCDEEGWPLSVEVFPGNEKDSATFANQVRKVADRFGGGEVTLVGDRGMIKRPQIDVLTQTGSKFHYITAITKPQIRTLLNEGTLQMDLFDEDLAEVVDSKEGVRYVMRRNPQRALEMADTRREKVRSIERLVSGQNNYLAEHPLASEGVAVRRVKEKIEKLRVSTWLSVSCKDRVLSIERDEETYAEVSKLDGCYCLKTDLDSKTVSKELVHDRYKSLATVEWAFRTCKTYLDARPIYVCKETRTRGHVFVVMLAYIIQKELAKKWEALNLTVTEGINELGSLCMTEVTIKKKTTVNQVPTPRPSVKRLLQAAEVLIPKTLPHRGVRVYTKKKLPSERKRLLRQ